MGRKISGLEKIRDRDKAVTLLTEAFADYPQLTGAFPQKDRRLAVMRTVLQYQVNLSMRYGGVYGLSRECREAVLMLPSSCRNPSGMQLFLSGNKTGRYRHALRRLTPEEQQVMNQVFSEMEQMEAEIPFPPKYLYLSYLGVKAEYQRQGRGRKLMENLLTYGKKKKLPVVFFTNQPDLVPFYQGLGFQVMGITSSRNFQFINIYLIKF